MEDAERGGERGFGALEDGGDASRAPPGSPNIASQGPQDVRSGRGAERGPGDDDRSHETDDKRPGRDSGSPCADEGRTEGPRDTGCATDEGPRHARITGVFEGPGDDSRETPSHSGSSVNEGPRHSGTGVDEGSCCSGTGSDEGPRHSGTGVSEGPRHSGTGVDEGPPHSGTGVDEGPCCSGTGVDEGPGRTVSTNEGPARAHEVPETPDVPADQRHEGPRDAGTRVQGPSSLPPAKELPAHGAPEEQQRPGGSFKKPVAPPGGAYLHEKSLGPGGSHKPPRPPDGQAAPDVLPRCRGAPAAAVPYQEPPWSGLPEALYSLEVLKGGAILDTKDLSRAAWTVFGRLPVCHVPLEHPSVSRFHAVLQYRADPGDDQERGFYVYDLGSTHGTFVNKQRIPAKSYRRVRVGHVMKFGGSTRLFILQGPAEDEEAESELTVTQIKEERRHKEELQKRMLGDDSDSDDEPSEEAKKPQSSAGEEAGCTWGMGEDAVEEESEENPIAMEFQEEREASYIKNPKKTLQGFFDREGEELEFEYEERSPGSWLCRVKLPADDPSGKQLVAEVTHSGKKKEAANLCSLEACRMLEMRGLLRQEAVSRKRKAKKWEDEDFYDSDDDTFLDRTGIVEKKRLNRMKKAGKIEEKPETFESLSTKLELVEKEMAEVAAKLKTSHTDAAQTSTQDSLDAFMTEMKAGSSLDSVSRRKLHLRSLELKKEQQRMKSLIKLVQPAKLPELRADPTSEDSKPKKLTLPLFGAMKGGSKFKLKTGTVGRLPPKRTELPASLFTMKDNDEPEEEEEDEDEPMKVEEADEGCSEDKTAASKIDSAPETQSAGRAEEGQMASPGKRQDVPRQSATTRPLNGQKKPETPNNDDDTPKAAAERQKKMRGPSKPPRGVVSTQYPEDDPDYCVWTPPAGQSGDGKTHLNEKYGY